MRLPINIMISLAVGVIIIAMVFFMVVNWDVEKNADDFLDVYFERNNVSDFNSVSRLEFVEYLADFWRGCDFSDSNVSLKFYIYENGTLSRDYLFSVVKSLNWCDTLQSSEFDCGPLDSREDIVLSHNISLPQLVMVECKNESLFIS